MEGHGRSKSPCVTGKICQGANTSNCKNYQSKTAGRKNHIARENSRKSRVSELNEKVSWQIGKGYVV